MGVKTSEEVKRIGLGCLKKRRKSILKEGGEVMTVERC